MSSHYGIDGTPNIVLIGVPDVAALKEACALLSENRVPHWSWTEPDFGLGFTAIATAPLVGEERKFLVRYQTWKEEFNTGRRGGSRAGFSANVPPVRAGSLIGKAADSNSVHSGFESRPALHSPKKIGQSPASRTLQESEITDLFDRLNLSTAADREKFLRFGQISTPTDTQE